jgi:RimJ/RimL family protein N-acetyltransferase
MTPLPPAILVGDGLLLRPWDRTGAPDELAALRIALVDPEMGRWNPVAVQAAPSEEDLRRWIDSRTQGWTTGEGPSWCVRDASGGEVLGHVAVRAVDAQQRTARIGYWTMPGARGRGVASRALEAATRWAFAELPVHRLELGHGVGHEASCRIALRCGYAPEGTLRQALPNAAGDLLDLHLHARLSTDPLPA